MSAPVRTRPKPRHRGPGAAPAPRPGSSRAAGGATSAAAQRAYARRTERTQRWLHLVPDAAAGSTAVRRVPFVALVMGLLGVGLVATLWLSTRAAEDSYRLGAAQEQTQLLAERAEALRRDVNAASSASSLAQRAAGLGMVPTDDVAHLVVAVDGSVGVVGVPVPAGGLPGPSLIAPEVAPAPAPEPEPGPAQEPDPQPAPSPPAVDPTQPPNPEQLAPVRTPAEQIVPGTRPAAGGA